MTQLISSSQLANRIRNTRKLRKLSQQALAKLSGVDQSQVSRIESGKVVQPTLSDVVSLATALSLPLEALVDQDDASFELLLKTQIEETDNESGDEQEEKDPAQLRKELLLALGGGLVAQGLIEQMDSWIRGGGYIILDGPGARQRDLACLMLGLPSLSEAIISSSSELDSRALSGQGISRGLESISGNSRVYLPTVSDLEDLALDLGKKSPPFSGGIAMAKKPGYKINEDSGLSVETKFQLCSSGVIYIELMEEEGFYRASQLLYTQGGEVGSFVLYACLDGVLEHRNNPIAVSAPRHYLSEAGSDDSELIGKRSKASRLHPKMFQNGVLLTGTGDARRNALVGLAQCADASSRALVMLTSDWEVACSAARAVKANADGSPPLVLKPYFNPLDVRSPHHIPIRVDMMGDWMERMLGLDPVYHAEALAYAKLATWPLCEANLRGVSGSDAQPFNLMQIGLFLTDTIFRRAVMEFCTNLAICETFAEEGPYEKLGDKKRNELLSPLLLAFSALTTNQEFMEMFTQEGLGEGEELRWDFINNGELGNAATREIICQPNDDFSFHSFALMYGHVLVSWASSCDRGVTLILDDAGHTFGPHLYPALSSNQSGLYIALSVQSPENFQAEDFFVIRRNVQSFISARLDSISARPISELVGAGGARPRPSDLAALSDGELWVNICSGESAKSGPEKVNIRHSLLIKDQHKPNRIVPALQGQGDGSSGVAQAVRELYEVIQKRAQGSSSTWQSAEAEEEAWDSANWDWGR